MWILLFRLIYTVAEISTVDGAPQKENISTISKSEIRAKREQLERQYHAEFLVNEDVYRKWPELQEEPKCYCLTFLHTIFPQKKNLDFITPRIQKVILNYKYIRGLDNTLTSKSVTALECKLKNPIHRRKLIYFMRSPQSPKCVLFLNKLRKNSSNFYIVEDICKYHKYTSFWKYAAELEKDELGNQTNTKRKHNRKDLLLPVKERQIKYAEFEKSHFEYCSVNTETCKMWPEIQMKPECECRRFYQKILPQIHNILVVTSRAYPVILHYLEIDGENNEGLDPAVVNAVACKLPQPVDNCKHIHLIRAPSYPNCVYFVIQRVLLTEHVFIAEEICYTLNFGTTLHKILSENRIRSTEFLRRITYLANETTFKLKEYENLHFQDWSIKQTEYKEWPELQEIDIKSYCQTIVENVFPEIVSMYGIGNLIAKSESVKIRYEAMRTTVNEKIPKRKVKALECIVSEEPTMKRFHFIRTPKPDCVYWVKQRRTYNVFSIAQEFCKEDTKFANLLGVNFDGGGDHLSNTEPRKDDEGFMEYLYQTALEC